MSRSLTDRLYMLNLALTEARPHLKDVLAHSLRAQRARKLILSGLAGFTLTLLAIGYSVFIAHSPHTVLLGFAVIALASLAVGLLGVRALIEEAIAAAEKLSYATDGVEES